MITDKTKRKIKELKSYDLNNKLLAACTKGDVDIVDYLLFSDELKEHASFSLTDGMYFKVACIGKHLSLLDYFIHNKQFKAYIDIKDVTLGNFNAINYSFMKSCMNGNLKVVDFLFNDSSISHLIDIAYAFKYACSSGRLNIIKYFMDDIDKSSLVQLESNDYEAFKNACEYGHTDVVKYLLTKGCPKHYINEYGTEKLQDEIETVIDL